MKLLSHGPDARAPSVKRRKSHSYAVCCWQYNIGEAISQLIYNPFPQFLSRLLSETERLDYRLTYSEVGR